jgi:hypothetical protein
MTTAFMPKNTARRAGMAEKPLEPYKPVAIDFLGQQNVKKPPSSPHPEVELLLTAARRCKLPGVDRPDFELTVASIAS